MIFITIFERAGKYMRTEEPTIKCVVMKSTAASIHCGRTFTDSCFLLLVHGSISKDVLYNAQTIL